MQDPARGPELAYNASLVLRIGSAVFVACSDDRLQQLYYRVDAGVRATWNHLRGHDVDPALIQGAEKANDRLGEQAAALRLPADFVVGHRDLAAAALAKLDRDEPVSRTEMAARALATVAHLEEGLDSAAGAVEFERSCQVSTDALLGGWAEDPLSTMRAVRRESGGWALAYQRFVKPELGRYHA